MAPELSSNWKRLQATLKLEAKDKPVSKRKEAPTERQRNTIAKRRRIEESKPFRSITARPLQLARKPKMGGAMSVESTESPEPTSLAPSACLALWAEDNDISAKDLAEA